METQIQSEGEPIPRSTIFVATKSDRRERFLRELLEPLRFKVERISAGEPKTEDPVVAANGKVNSALRDPKVQELRRKGSRAIGVIAADVRTRPLIIRGTEVERTLSLGKPTSEHEVMKNFERMGRTTNSYCTIVTGTSLDWTFDKNRKRISPPSTTTMVYLDREKIAQFGTPEGFLKYKEAYYRHYSLKDYGFDKEHPIPPLTEIAAGFSTGVMLSLGAVTQIDETPRGDPDNFPKVAKRTLFSALYGFSPKVLERLRSDAQDFIDRWPPLDRITQHALAGASAQA
jgi:hypothetical protein